MSKESANLIDGNNVDLIQEADASQPQIQANSTYIERRKIEPVNGELIARLATEEDGLTTDGQRSPQRSKQQEIPEYCEDKLEAYSDPQNEPCFSADPKSHVEISTEQAMKEFEIIKNKVSQLMGVPVDRIQYNDKYFSPSFRNGTTNLSEILEKGESPVAGGYDPYSKKITISRGLFAIKDSAEFNALVKK